MIKENVKRILAGLPPGVELVGAAKKRTAEEILEAVEAGVKIIGENYVQEGMRAFEKVGKKVKWHFIGHLQRNKVKKAVKLFDMIQSVDSISIAAEINEQSRKINKIMPVLIEINSGRELQKFGVLPQEVEKVIRNICEFSNIEVMGLMTMGDYLNEREDSRLCFVETKKIFDKIASFNLPGVKMKYLSMGMSATYRMGIEEGANMVRIGTEIFGERIAGSG